MTHSSNKSSVPPRPTQGATPETGQSKNRLEQLCDRMEEEGFYEKDPKKRREAIAKIIGELTNRPAPK